MTDFVLWEMDLRARELHIMESLARLEEDGGLLLGSMWSGEALALARDLDGVHEEMERFGMRPVALEEGRVLVAA